MAKPTSSIPQKQLEAFDQLVSSFPEVERKGKTMPYTSLNGHMFSHLDKSGNMGLRLSNADREAFITKYDSKIFEQHGRQMKEYVAVPDELLLNTDELMPYFQQSLDYINTLKPKATSKKK